MIAWDTNYLVRYVITDDNADQSASVFKTVIQQKKKGDLIFISFIVLCEMVWVLKAAYGLKKKQLVEVLNALNEDSNLQFEDAGILTDAIKLYDSGKGDFSDYAIGLIAKRSFKASTTCSFDKALKSCSLFTV